MAQRKPLVQVAGEIQQLQTGDTIGGLVGNFYFTLSSIGGLVIGKIPGFWTCPFAGTIQAWNLTVDTGTITLAIWKIVTGTVHPTSANTINTSGISLTTGTSIRSTVLTDFTTLAVSVGDIFAAQILAVSGVQDFGGSIEILKS